MAQHPPRATPTNPAADPPVRWIGLEDAAGLLGVHPRTVRRLIASGELEGRRLGTRLVRVREADVQALLEPIHTADAPGQVQRHADSNASL
jgi:excisionase family DNA binding protein